uniref:Uncharacterized protein n=1 Tax=Chromera velia CCMP2878 TaxID=1169474 RepID=A0A0G4I3Q6_9ALVE|eukprot:Cvel_10728.t1-p1 / transcript=Cvel_10728.t1 / gene=Cvel_10728 / organism=Chromera_velia_CCMP2878 / gene_product=hypothetical protein / transcript_product=hypothetical protein / location=Cvel_scaffold653:74047-74298(+) / protein_length=84 / sequence_SO=supercontig / SO=protein_coding / is_pseudo=false
MSGGETLSGGKTRLFHPNLFDFGKGGERRAGIVPSQPLRWQERRREGRRGGETGEEESRGSQEERKGEERREGVAPSQPLRWRE